MSKKNWETDGTRNGDPIYCPSMPMVIALTVTSVIYAM